jgi:hypothetical protein
MTEPMQPGPETAAAFRDQLRKSMAQLRAMPQIEPEVRQVLADFVDELSRHLDPNVPAAEAAHLAESSAHLVEALARKHHPGLIAAARDRLEAAATRAETAAPVATGLARRLIDTLANLGI